MLVQEREHRGFRRSYRSRERRVPVLRVPATQLLL